MGYFDQFGGSPVRGLLGDDGARALDPNWMRDELANNAMTPKPEKHGPSFKDVVGFLGEMAMNVGATWGMSPYETARYYDMQNDNKLARKKYQQEQGVLRQAFAAIDADPNMTPQEKAIVKANPSEYVKNYVQRFGTHNVNAGDTLTRDLGGGNRDVFVAPKTFQEGADVAQMPAQSFRLSQSAPMLPGAGDGDYRGAAVFGSAPHLFGAGAPAAGPPGMMGSGGPDGRPVIGLRTQAEQYADSLGLNRGTSDWGNAVRDYTLKEYGPTANSEKRTLKSWELGQSDVNNRRTTAASRYGTDASVANRNNTPAATMVNGNGEVVVAYPDNRVTTLRGSRPTPTTRQPGAGRGGSAGDGVAEGTIIRHPRTGQRMVRRNGKWAKL